MVVSEAATIAEAGARPNLLDVTPPSAILAAVTLLSAILAVVTLESAILAVVTELEARLAAAMLPLNSLYMVSKSALTSDDDIVVFGLKVVGLEMIPMTLSSHSFYS